MAGFDSPNFKKSVQSHPRPMREFNIAPEEQQVSGSRSVNYSFGPPQEDPQGMSLQQAELAREEARKQKLAEQNKITDNAKKRIELLGDIGRTTREVNIGGFSFSLRTLKSKETREAALATFSTSITQLEASYEARKQQLARSIFRIDGEDVEMVLGTKNVEDVMKFIENDLEELVVEKLWIEFMALKDEARTKYGITTAKEAEEVAEDLKK